MLTFHATDGGLEPYQLDLQCILGELWTDGDQLEQRMLFVMRSGLCSQHDAVSFEKE